jgi:hypothetical protein
MTAAETFLQQSPIYDPVAVLRREGEVLIVARVGVKASRRFMILTPAAQPAWPHEAFSRLSDVGWSLQANQWHRVSPEPTGPNPQPAKMLARLLSTQA